MIERTSNIVDAWWAAGGNILDLDRDWAYDNRAALWFDEYGNSFGYLDEIGNVDRSDIAAMRQFLLDMPKDSRAVWPPNDQGALEFLVARARELVAA